MYVQVVQPGGCPEVLCRVLCFFADFYLKVVMTDFVGKYLGGIMNCLYKILYMLSKLWFIIASIATYIHYTLEEEMASGAP